MFKVGLEVKSGLTFFELKSITLKLQLILPTLALSIDDKSMIRIHSINGGVTSGLEVADALNLLKDLVHLSHSSLQDVIGVSISVELIPSFLELFLETPFLHRDIVQLLLCVVKFGSLNKYV